MGTAQAKEKRIYTPSALDEIQSYRSGQHYPSRFLHQHTGLRTTVGIDVNTGDFVGDYEILEHRDDITTKSTIQPKQTGLSTMGLIGKYLCKQTRQQLRTGGTASVLAIEDNGNGFATVFMDGCGHTLEYEKTDGQYVFYKQEVRATTATEKWMEFQDDGSHFDNPTWHGATPVERLDDPAETERWGFGTEYGHDVAFFSTVVPIQQINTMTTSPPIAPSDHKREVSIVGAVTSNMYNIAFGPVFWGPSSGQMCAFSATKGTKLDEGTDTNMIPSFPGLDGAGVADVAGTHCGIQSHSLHCNVNERLPLAGGFGNVDAIRCDNPAYLCGFAKHILKHMNHTDKTLVLKELYASQLARMGCCPRERGEVSQQLADLSRRA